VHQEKCNIVMAFLAFDIQEYCTFIDKVLSLVLAFKHYFFHQNAR